MRNLPKDVAQAEMVDLFDRFAEGMSHSQAVVYTLLTGRMKGQAFVEYCEPLEGGLIRSVSRCCHKGN